MRCRPSPHALSPRRPLPFTPPKRPALLFHWAVRSFGGTRATSIDPLLSRQAESQVGVGEGVEQHASVLLAFTLLTLSFSFTTTAALSQHRLDAHDVSLCSVSRIVSSFRPSGASKRAWATCTDRTLTPASHRSLQRCTMSPIVPSAVSEPHDRQRARARRRRRQPACVLLPPPPPSSLGPRRSTLGPASARTRACKVSGACGAADLGLASAGVHGRRLSLHAELDADSLPRRA